MFPSRERNKGKRYQWALSHQHFRGPSDTCAWLTVAGFVCRTGPLLKWTGRLVRVNATRICVPAEVCHVVYPFSDERSFRAVGAQ